MGGEQCDPRSLTKHCCADSVGAPGLCVDYTRGTFECISGFKAEQCLPIGGICDPTTSTGGCCANGQCNNVRSYHECVAKEPCVKVGEQCDPTAASNTGNCCL